MMAALVLCAVARGGGEVIAQTLLVRGLARDARSGTMAIALARADSSGTTAEEPFRPVRH